MPKRTPSDTVALISMVSSIFAFGILWGVFASNRDLFPAHQIRKGVEAFERLSTEQEAKWYLSLNSGTEPIYTGDIQHLMPGLVMLVGVTTTDTGPRNFIRVINRSGRVIHSWQPDWFQIWDDGRSFPKRRRPQSQPGALLHGAALADNGDVIFNFEHLSTVRLSACGDPVWKLANFGHHSVHIDETGTIWVSAEDTGPDGKSGQQNHLSPLRSWTIQRISPTGQILGTTAVLDILRDNDLLGLMHMSTLANDTTEVSGDTMHLNDIETFPSSLRSTVFEPGDVMISLRNINTILVMDPKLRDVKFRATGQFLRQHDPDFAANDRILILDNRNLSPSDSPEPLSSRILELDATSGAASVLFQGTGENAFYTYIMGKHQRLDNGNLMITSSTQGRAFEITRDGQLLWDYNNLLDEGMNGVLTEATVLPAAMNEAFFESLSASCE